MCRNGESKGVIGELFLLLEFIEVGVGNIFLITLFFR